MTPNLPHASAVPLRLWPGVLLLVLQWVARFVVPPLFPDAGMVGFLASLALTVAILIWWLFFSRAPWGERFAVLAVIVLALFVTSRVVHPSIAGGMMGFMLPVVAAPIVCLALVGAALVTRTRSAGARRTAIVAAVVLATGSFALLRTGGMTSEANSDFHPRWTKTPEERLLAEASAPQPAPAVTKAPAAAPKSVVAAGHVWPGFRGAHRDSVIRGAAIETNWSVSPPVELWRKPVGPAWSSFSVSGNRCFTQEQRGEQELVVCYDLGSGDVVWQHGDTTRFWESNAGPGPRGTPTLHEERVYTFGATGIVNALNDGDGKVVWSRNAAKETGAKLPDWGFSSSPLVVGDLVVVAVSGTLAAYDRATGEPRWTGPKDGNSYCSPHLLEVHGTPQVLLISGSGARALAPKDGALLWQHDWKGFGITQPAQIEHGHLIISTGDRSGIRRIEVANTGGKWTATERWTSTRLKPYFNDFVLHRGHAFGFDSGSLTCVELEQGERKWKGGRYGSGQLFLLAGPEVLVVLSEQGQLALVSATTNEFTELARFPALKGKTWNHPVLAGDVLLVRNDQEMVAFRLPLKRT